MIKVKKNPIETLKVGDIVYYKHTDSFYIVTRFKDDYGIKNISKDDPCFLISAKTLEELTLAIVHFNDKLDVYNQSKYDFIIQQKDFIKTIEEINDNEDIKTNEIINFLESNDFVLEETNNDEDEFSKWQNDFSSKKCDIVPIELKAKAVTEVKQKLFKVDVNVADKWDKFVEEHKEYRVQQLISLALEEFIDKYTNKETNINNIIEKTFNYNGDLQDRLKSYIDNNARSFIGTAKEIGVSDTTIRTIIYNKRAVKKSTKRQIDNFLRKKGY